MSDSRPSTTPTEPTWALLPPKVARKLLVTDADCCVVNIAPKPDKSTRRTVGGFPAPTVPLPDPIFLCLKPKPCPDHPEEPHV